MPRSPFPTILLAACSVLPAMALELSDLRLPLTRGEADKLLSRDYNFCILKDMTVRRSWELRDRRVSVDFSPKEDDKALLIFVDYTRPVEPAVAHDDAVQMLGIQPDKWQAVNQKRALRLGMEAAEGFKLPGGRYCFRELDERGKVTRLVYYAGIPKDVRWDLARDARESGKTALGSRTASGASEALWRDEERRRGVSASSSASSLESAAAAVVADAPNGAEASPKKKQMIPRPEEEVDLVDKLKGYAEKLTPTHYAIGGGVLGLLLLLRTLARAREAKKRAMVADYIMNHGAIKVDGKRRK